MNIAVKMIITDGVMEKALDAFHESMNETRRSETNLRAALEAVVPVLIAAELRRWGEPAFDVVSTKMLRDRAQELDPK